MELLKSHDAGNCHTVSLTLAYLMPFVFKTSCFMWQLPSYRARTVGSWELVNKSERKGHELERSGRKLNWLPGFPCTSYHSNNLVSLMCCTLNTVLKICMKWILQIKCKYSANISNLPFKIHSGKFD